MSWIFFLLVFSILFLSFACQKPSARRVEFINRNSFFQSPPKTTPLTLLIEIKPDGKLTLNRIETGTVTTPEELAEKLRVVFEDREKAKIKEREILVNATKRISPKDLDKLIDLLKRTGAEPIRIFRDS